MFLTYNNLKYLNKPHILKAIIHNSHVNILIKKCYKILYILIFYLLTVEKNYADQNLCFTRLNHAHGEKTKNHCKTCLYWHRT